MEKKKLGALLLKIRKSLGRMKIYGDLRKTLKFNKKVHKFHEKLEKKIGDDAFFEMGFICRLLSAEHPEEEAYSTQACNYFEYAYTFNDGDSRAVNMLKKHFGLLEVPDAAGKPFYFYIWAPQFYGEPDEPFEFQGKLYRKVYTINRLDHSDHFVTCTKSSDGEMTYQLVTDYAERDALHKREWSL